MASSSLKQNGDFFSIFLFFNKKQIFVFTENEAEIGSSSKTHKADSNLKIKDSGYLIDYILLGLDFCHLM